jgi:type I restriction enzyme, S subunit
MKKGWPRKTLGEVSQFRGGGTPSKTVERYWRGDIPWVSPKDMKFDVVSDSIDHISQEAIDGSATSLIPKDSVLIVVRSGILARTVPIAITGRDLAINQDLKALCPNGAVYARFLYHLLDSKMDVLLSMVSRGATVHRLMTNQIRALDFILPPLPEQQRIVSVLDEAFEGVVTAKANAEKNRQNARAIFESHLQSIFTKRGKDWVEKPLAELCEIKHGLAFDGAFFSNIGDYVLLTPGNFYEEGGYRDRGERQKYYIGEIPRDYVLNEGDLLVAMTEQAAGLLGSPILIPESDKFLHNQRLGLVTKKPGVPWTNELFFHVFNTQAVRREIHDSASGVKVRHTSPTKIGEVVVSFPTSIPEQREIASTLNDLREQSRRLESIYERKVVALEALKKSLLHQTFSGNL